MAKRKRRHDEVWQARVGTRVFNPLEVMELQEALRGKEKRVKLGDRWFLLRYQDDGETVFYSPEKGSVPCGYLNIDKLLRSL